MTSHDEYYGKYIKYKQKYELLKNDMNGGGYWWTWPFTSTSIVEQEQTNFSNKSIIKEDKPSYFSIFSGLDEKQSYNYLLKYSYFNLFFCDIPKYLNKLKQNGGEQPSILPKKDDKDPRKYVLWTIANPIYNELMEKNPNYPELSYSNSMNNLNSYIITIIIKRIFQLELENKTSLSINTETLSKQFKQIGLYIYIKLFQLLHKHGSIQSNLIQNKLAQIDNAITVNSIIKKLEKIRPIFLEVFRNNSVISENLKTLFSSDIDGTINLEQRDNSNLSVNIIMLLGKIENNPKFKQILAMENLYFFNAFIELTVIKLLYNKQTFSDKQKKELETNCFDTTQLKSESRTPSTNKVSKEGEESTNDAFTNET
jgi:hypothetical protein